MLKNQILYSKPSGSKILFDELKDGVMYAHVWANGQDYESRSLTGILAKGYWDEVYISNDVDTIEKHGSHDQKTHGNWATGNYENLSDWIKEELSVFASDEEREKYIQDTIESQHISAYNNTKFSGAVETYEGRIGYELNEALRDPLIGDDEFTGTIKKLDEAIDAIEPIKEELIAYRGVKGNGLDFFNKLKVGDIYEDKGFTSTTIDPYVAKQFGGQQPYYEGLVFKYKLPAGTKGIFPGAFTDKSIGRDTSEAEFLLPRGSKFKVTAIRGKVWDVELIP